MEGEAISATIGVLVKNLITVSKDEFSLIRGLEKNADKLKGTLSTIQTSLDDARKKFITDDAVNRWLRDLEAVAFDADNVLDELDYNIISNKMKPIRTPNKNTTSCCPSFKRYVHRRQMALDINEINTSFESIDKRATVLGLERRLADAPAAPDAPASETDSFTVDPIFIGRDGDVSEIVEMLTTTMEQALLSILPIVGMGGLGKTTLTRKVFNHEKTKTAFGLRIWVHVSQNFDTVALLKKILKILKPDDDEVEISREVLLQKIREALGAKTYLLILDDVWNQDRHKWEDFINSWSGISSTMGNCIIVTTRNTKVGSIVNTIGIHQLNSLSVEECWSIIKGRAFKGGETPSGFEVIGKSIAERCQGLPLAANVVGGVLRDKSRDEWLSIKDNWLPCDEEDEDNISSILRLSYDHLSSPSLKRCFAYCSVFPKGSVIEKGNLIQLWMAEGFLQPSPKIDMESAGNRLFDLLVQSSLLHAVDMDEYNYVKHCRMHDLVHDVAASVLGSPKVNDNTTGGICRARYVWWKSQGDESRCIPKDQTKWHRTLFYEGEISDVTFSDFKSLHVLILVCHLDELPDSIRELRHLRFLNISQTGIRKLPNSIGELYHLQTFKANAWRLKKLPSTFKYLFNLRHLHVRVHTKLPRKLGMLSSLQTLPYFKVRDVEGYRIVELASLKNLKGSLKIYNLENVQGEDESNKACLFEKPGILTLGLRWDERREGETNDASVLRGLQPHPNLKILEIFGFDGVNFPSWTLKMEGLNNLMEIKLESCAKCEEIPTLGHLPCLKSIYLSNLKNVKTISCSFYRINNFCFNDVFPTLERLELIEMPNLREWVEVENPTGAEVKVFPRLEYLKIKKCNQLTSVPSIFPCLKVLKIEEMDSGMPLENICGINLTSLVKLHIRGLRKTVCLPDLLFYNSPSLLSLSIDSCNELTNLPKGLDTLNSLEQLTIWKCNNLKSIQFPGARQPQGLTSLRRLSICSDTGINIPREMVESCVSSLKELRLYGSVTDMPTVIECMQKMHHLTVLDMYSVPKLIISSPTVLGSLRSLNSLSFHPDGSWDCASFNNAVGEVLRMVPRSLQTLNLTGYEDWKSLPDQLQHLTALSKLHLRHFGIEELPEWFGNLSSLEELRVHCCQKLKCRPYVEVMRRLTKLTYLNITKCPLLVEGGIEQHVDVPNMWVNGRYVR